MATPAAAATPKTPAPKVWAAPESPGEPEWFLEPLEEPLVPLVPLEALAAETAEAAVKAMTTVENCIVVVMIKKRRSESREPARVFIMNGPSAVCRTLVLRRDNQQAVDSGTPLCAGRRLAGEAQTQSGTPWQKHEKEKKNPKDD